MTLKLISVGVGGRGRHWLDFIHTQADAEIVACVDVDEPALKQVGEEFGCATFTSLESALAEKKAHGVIIASPSLLHGPHARQALEAGYPTLVEKPLAASLSEAVDVVQLARQVKLPLMVAENYRFFCAERTLRGFLDSGTPGPVRRAVCVDRRDQPSTTQGAWVKKMEQPFLTEIAVHHFDSFRYLFDRKPVAIWARTFNPQGSDYDQNGALETLLEMEDGLTVQYSGSFVGSRYEYSLLIEAENGDIKTDRNRVWWRPRGERRFRPVEPVSMPEGEALRYPEAGMLSMLAQFREAINGGAEPETSGADNLWTLAMFESAIESTRDGGYVQIEDTFPLRLQARAGVSQGLRPLE